MGVLQSRQFGVCKGTWPAYILTNEVKDGQTWGRRLTILEGFGAAQTMVIWAEDIVDAGAVASMVDNTGF